MKVSKFFGVFVAAVSLVAASSVALADDGNNGGGNPPGPNPNPKSSSSWKTTAKAIVAPLLTTGAGAGIGRLACVAIPVPGSAICFWGLTAAGAVGGFVYDGVLLHKAHLARDAQTGSTATVAENYESKTVASTGCSGVNCGGGIASGSGAQQSATQ